jgi:hypothetical protein
MVNNLLKTTRIILVRIDGTKAILFTKNPCRFHKLLSGYVLMNNFLGSSGISGKKWA